MKSEERQHQMKELLLKLLNGTKTSEKDSTFFQGTIYSTIETFEYVPENDKTVYEFYRRYEDVFNVDCKEWSNEKRYVYYSGNLVRLNTVGSLILSKKKQWIWSFQRQLNYYLNCLGPNTSLFHKRWKCLNIFKDGQQDYLTFAATVNKHSNDFKLPDLTADDFKCLIFAQGLGLSRIRCMLTKLENEQGLTLKKLAENC